MVPKKHIGLTADNIYVYAIIDNKHMLSHSDVSEELIIEAIQKVTFGLENNERMITVDMGRIIGKQACVPTTPEDKIVLARRPGQPHPSRIVCYKNPIPTTKLTLGLSISTTGENMDGLLTVNTAYYGDKIPKELNDPELSDQEKTEAEAYWKNHALCSLSIFGKHQPPREAIVSKKLNIPGVRTNKTEDELCL